VRLEDRTVVAALGESMSDEIEAALGHPGHFLSDPIRVLRRKHEVELIEEQGRG
jgi:hypothetical protein